MDVAIAVVVAAAALVVAGAVVLVRARTASTASKPGGYSKQLRVADANTEAATIVNEATGAAQHAREVAADELSARRAAVESLESVLEERERHLRERRTVFDER